MQDSNPEIDALVARYGEDTVRAANRFRHAREKADSSGTRLKPRIVATSGCRVSRRLKSAYESPVISTNTNENTIARKESGAGCHAGYPSSIESIE